MKTIVLLCVVIVSCRSFAQFKPYDPNNPNPSEVDVFKARRFADEERREAFNVGDATSLDAQRHQQNAMEAERDAHLLEDRMRANESRRAEEEKRRREEEEQRWAEAAEQRRRAAVADQLAIQAGIFNGVDRILTQEESSQLVKTEEPKVAEYCHWNVAASYSVRNSASRQARKRFIEAYKRWFKEMGYHENSAKAMMRDVEKIFDAYVKDYNNGMCLTTEPKPEDYSDKSRFVEHYIAFTQYIPHGYFKMTSEQRQDYFFANRAVIQARKELAGSCWNFAHSKKRIAEQQRRSGTQGNKASKAAGTRKQR